MTGAGRVDVLYLKSNPTTVGDLAGRVGFATDYRNVGGVRDPMSNLLTSRPTAGVVLINEGIRFFVDSSPDTDTEYRPVTGAPATYLQATSGRASTDYDLLSTALHELGHVLGFTSAFHDFWKSVQPSPHLGDSSRPVYAFQRVPQIGNRVRDYNADPHFLVDGGVFLVNAGEEQEGFANQGVSSHVDDTGGFGFAAGFFPYDAMNPGLAAGERRHASFADADVLCDAFGYSCGAVVPEPSGLTLAVLGLVGLGARKRRSRS